MKTQRYLFPILFILATLFGHHPVKAAPSQKSIKRPDLVFKVNGTDLVHIITIYNQGTIPAQHFIITLKGPSGNSTNYFFTGLAVGETKYITTIFQEYEEQNFMVTADPLHQVIELDEKNNQREWGLGTRTDW